MALLLTLLLLCAYCVAPLSWGLAPTNPEPLALASSLLVHNSLSHLLPNAVGFCLLARLFERRHGAVTLLLFAGMTGMLTQGIELLAQPGYEGLIIGASGIVYALLGSVPFPQYVPFPKTLRLFTLLALLYPFYEGSTDTIAHYAHLSGFLLGSLWAVRRS